MLLWLPVAAQTPNPKMQIRSRLPRTGDRPGRLLLVGPRVIDGDVVGGPQVTFESVVTEVARRADIGLTIVSTARPLARRGKLGKAFLDALTLVLTLARTWRHAAKADLVVWFVSARAALLAGSGMWLVCALRRRPLCIRLFGGSFDVYLESAPAPWRLIANRTFLKAELLLAETKDSAARLEAVCTARWMPNTRDLPPRRQPYRPSCRRLLFLSVLQPEKGLPELVAAAPRFPPGVRLTVCGPETPGFDVTELEHTPHTSYGGVVPPERVPEVMEAHDAVVLPTRWSTEGYSGVVIEAFQMGLPVIVSRHRSLQELVTEDRDGLFVEPGSVDSLVEAVVRLSSDDALFHRLRQDALRTGELYRSARSAAVFEDLCRRAAAGQRP
ncbi:MAG: glycosyltransferase family 4 protein [Acidobacteria bacterium]|nr:glycosyltransferase family 4 protein [Acidobacteriota bacterium]MYH23147.1 glycosyltransferase family 4 protein [Acidobacteriota bacterium]